MLLHEIELHSSSPEESKKFYREILGLTIAHTNNDLTVFQHGVPDIYLNTSNHFREKISLSFLVNDIESEASRLRQLGCTFTGPEPTHLGMVEIVLNDPDGNRIALQAVTAQSPEWLRQKAATI